MMGQGEGLDHLARGLALSPQVTYKPRQTRWQSLPRPRAQAVQARHIALWPSTQRDIEGGGLLGRQGGCPQVQGEMLVFS